MELITLKFNAIEMLGLAALGLVMGGWLKRKLPVLDRLHIPGSIAGGLVYALFALLLRDRFVNFEVDTVVRDVLMVAFFTTIGMHASLELLRAGGVQVAIFLGAAVLGLAIQIVWGVGAAAWFGLDPLLGVIPGAVALTGGPATALAFGGPLEELGVESATALGLGSAMFGIVIGGLIGGHIGGVLIRRFQLTPAGAQPSVDVSPVDRELEESPRSASWPATIVVLCLAMGAGTIVNRLFTHIGLTVPIYIGPMICAGILRNLDDVLRGGRVSPARMELLGNVALELFIVMALLSLKLWEIAHLAVPVFVILCGQILILVLLCWTVVFRLMGRSHESAVMATGYFGFMMGTTANAMACMGELTRKYGPAPQAFFVVTIVGAFFIDFINALFITVSMNVLR